MQHQPVPTNPCVFCALLAAPPEDSQTDWVFRDAQVAAFLDKSPLFLGHVLVVPTTHVTTLADLPVADLASYFGAVQRLTRAVQSGLGSDGIFVANNNIVSQSVPHLHFHVIPRRKGDGLRGFFWPRQKYAGNSVDYAARIRAALETP